MRSRIPSPPSLLIEKNGTQSREKQGIQNFGQNILVVEPYKVQSTVGAIDWSSRHVSQEDWERKGFEPSTVKNVLRPEESFTLPRRKAIIPSAAGTARMITPEPPLERAHPTRGVRGGGSQGAGGVQVSPRQSFCLTVKHTPHDSSPLTQMCAYSSGQVHIIN